MSTINVFSIFDRAGGVYGTPFYSPNIQTAMRSVAHEVNGDPAVSVLASSPDDFDVFHLGTFSHDDSRFALFDVPVYLFRCASLVRATPAPGSIGEAN